MPSLISLQERHRKNKYIMLNAKYGTGEYKIAELNCAIIAGQIKDMRKPKYYEFGMFMPIPQKVSKEMLEEIRRQFIIDRSKTKIPEPWPRY